MLRICKSRRQKCDNNWGVESRQYLGKEERSGCVFTPFYDEGRR